VAHAPAIHAQPALAGSLVAAGGAPCGSPCRYRARCRFRRWPCPPRSQAVYAPSPAASEKLAVRRDDAVQAGQDLLRIASDELDAQARVLETERIVLGQEIARLAIGPHDKGMLPQKTAGTGARGGATAATAPAAAAEPDCARRSEEPSWSGIRRFATAPISLGTRFWAGLRSPAECGSWPTSRKPTWTRSAPARAPSFPGRPARRVWAIIRSVARSARSSSIMRRCRLWPRGLPRVPDSRGGWW